MIHLNKVICLVAIAFLIVANSVAQEKGITFKQESPLEHVVESLETKKDIQLKGIVIDQYGNPVSGAIIGTSYRLRRVFTTDEHGAFSIDKIDRNSRMKIEKSGYVSTSRKIQDFSYFLVDSTEVFVQIQLPVLDTKFVVGPEGVVHDGPIQITVPPGAVSTEIEIKACFLPTGYLESANEIPQASSLGVIHFEPSGFTFQKPINIEVNAPIALKQDAQPAVVHSYRVNGERRVEEITKSIVDRATNTWTFSISHFSDCQLVDKNTVIRKIPSNRDPSDVNMDGSMDDQDAERIVYLIGGPQNMEFTTTITAVQSVEESQGVSSGTSSSDTHTQGGGVSVKGVGASVEEENSTTLTKEQAESYGIELVEERSFSRTINVKVGEYNERCKMLFGLYDFEQVMKYIRMSPTASELANLKKNIGADSPDDDGWHYRKTIGGSSVALNRTIHDGMRLAVKVGKDGSLEVFVLVSDITVRRLKGLEAANCKAVKRTKPQSIRYREYTTGEGRGAVLYSIRYLGLKRGDEPFKTYRGIECGVELKDEWSESRVKMEFKEAEESTSNENTSTKEVKAGVDLEIAGIVNLSGQASHKTEKSKQIGAYFHQRVAGSESDKTTFALTIYDEHEVHESDHDLYPLYHVYEIRDWLYEFPNSDKISPGLKKKMREVKGAGSGKVQGRSADGGLVLLVDDNGKEYWYISRPPKIVLRDAGHQLIRIEERPCVEEPPMKSTNEKEDRTTEAVPYKKKSKKEWAKKDASKSKQEQSLPADDGVGVGGNNQYAPTNHQLSIGVGFALAFPKEGDHSPLDAINILNGAIFADPVVFEALSEELLGDFFIGTLSGETFIDPGELSQENGWYLAAHYQVNSKWTIAANYSRYTTEWTSYFPVTVIGLTDETFQLNGKLATDISATRSSFVLDYTINSNRLSPFVGMGIQWSKRSMETTHATIENVAFDVWGERDEEAWGVLLQAGLNIALNNSFSGRLRLQEALESLPSNRGEFSDEWVPTISLGLMWRVKNSSTH